VRKRRIKFIWGASGVIRGRWHLGLFGFYDREEGVQDDGLAISIRGLLVLALCLYFAVAAAVHAVYRRNPYNLITFQDVALYPVRPGVVAEKKGQALIAEGQSLAAARKWPAAVAQLERGLAQSPRDRAARLTLAHFHLANDRPSVALRWLGEGLGAEYPGRPYLEALFDAARRGEDYERIAEASARYLPQAKASGAATDVPWLAEQRFSALLSGGHADQALALAESETGEVAHEHRVLALLALGRAADATSFLREWRQRPGADAKALLRLEARAFREAGKLDEMDGSLAEWRRVAPNDVDRMVAAVEQLALAGRGAAATAALEELASRSDLPEGVLQRLAAPLAARGHVSLLQRCAALAKQRGYAADRFELAIVQSHVQRGEWDAAANALASVSPSTGADQSDAARRREWLQRLIDCGRLRSDLPQLALIELLEERAWPLEVYRQSVAALLHAGRSEAARDVSAIGIRLYPASKTLQEQRTAVLGQVAARALAAAKVANAAAPVPATARVLDEHEFFRRLDELVKAEQWDDAARHVKQADSLQPEPMWLSARDGAVRLAQVRIAYGRRDLPAAVAAVRLFLNSDERRAEQLLDVARTCFANGDKEFAAAFTREILRRQPNYAPAKRVQAEWNIDGGGE
jgi:hypothetical protein